MDVPRRTEHVYQQYQKKRRTPETERLSEGHQSFAGIPDEENKKERIDALYAAINTLSDLDKAIIFLYLEENSYDEIAGITGLSKTNVSVRIFRIKKTLEQKIKNKH